MSACIDDVSQWKCSNRLQLNALKTEYIWCAPARRRHHIPSSDVKIGPDSVRPVQSARHLGVYIDSDMTMTTHINHVLSSCFSALRQIRTIKRSLPPHALDTLVTSLVHSRLDYCNVVFAGLPARDLQRFNVCSQFSMLLCDSFPIHQVAVMSNRCLGNVTGCPSDSVCSTSCACWSTAVSTARRHPISPNSSSRPPSKATELV